MNDKITTTYQQDLDAIRAKIDELESMVSKAERRFYDGQHDFLGKAIKGEAEDGDQHLTVVIVKRMQEHFSQVRNVERRVAELRHAAFDFGNTNWEGYVK